MEPESIGRSEIKILSGYYCPVLYLSPFNTKQVLEFIDKKLPYSWCHHLCLKTDKINAFNSIQKYIDRKFPIYLLQAGKTRQQRKRALELIGQMQDLRMRPMLLQHIDKLLLANNNQKWNSYTVYNALVQQWLNREVRKLTKQHAAKIRLPNSKELFYTCLLIAEDMDRREDYLISEEELHDLIKKDKNIKWLLKFDLGGRSLLNRNSDRAFRFSHYTIQEFLLAYGIVNKKFSNRERLLRATDQLVHFVVLAQAFADSYQYIDFNEFNWKKYIESHGVPFFRNRLKDETFGPEMSVLEDGFFLLGNIKDYDKTLERPTH